MEVVKVFDEKFHQIIKNEVKNVWLEGSELSDSEGVSKREWIPDKPNTLSCSFCRASFENFSQHREHYKLDWHRYNLRQSLLHKSPITENEFEEKNEQDDISSISGSDSEKEDTLDTYATAQGKIFLQNNEGKVFSVYACLLYNKKKELNDEKKISIRDDLDFYCRRFPIWAILMLGGGHFAGAIFRDDVPILHKTFHCYTVRAGQGGSQSARDNKSGGSHPKSAGASLRRYNEQSFVQHIKKIIEGWKTELQKCGLIFYRAAGAYNRSVLFGGSVPLLDRNEKGLRTIPFSTTRRPTFAEVKRVHQKIATAHVYDTLESAIDHFSHQKLPEQNSKRNKLRTVSINRAKSREMVERPLPDIQASDTSDSSVEMTLSLDTELVNFEDTLLEFQDTLTPEQRQLIKKKRSRKSKSRKLKDREEQRKKELREMIVTSDLEKLTNMIEIVKKNENDNISSNILDEVIDDEGNTFLHVASIHQKIEIVRFLLENNVNLCVKNEKQQTPYTCTQNKDIREMFRQFARDNPEKYNYNKAQIPTNLLTPEELMEKKKAQRKVKKEKEKVKKEELKIKKIEESEKERFLHLSDREKRALAAERRILNQSGVVVVRCFLCASDMSGKVPFEYLGNRFCTIDCLKAHRLQYPIILS